MARETTKWPSTRWPITKIMSSDGCNGNRVPLEMGPWYDFREFGCHLGNVGLDRNKNGNSYLQATEIWLPIISIVCLAIFLMPRVRDNPFWRATVTPLASIIGSGFLIAAPLLGGIAGDSSPWIMFSIVVFSYWIGSVIRFNIRYLEPVFATGAAAAGLRLTERASEVALFGAYVISVAFYLRLMSAFVLDGAGIDEPIAARVMTTIILIGIGGVGWWRGLTALERLEEYSVSVKLAIIVALLAGLFHYDIVNGLGSNGLRSESRPLVDTMRMIAGLLLVTQGFETSRYLSAVYSTSLRIRSMRLAQWIAGTIYVCFAILIAPLLPLLPSGRPAETAIIELSRHAALVLPLLLIVAAVMSQFSAAVADTIGAGGLVREQSRGRFSPGTGYLIMTSCAVVLVWSANLFEIIAYASRAFAIYYLAQTALALWYSVVEFKGPRMWLITMGLGVMAAALVGVAIFAIPVG